MILKKKEIGQTVSNRFKATPYLFKFKPFSHLENCQTVANRFAKILEILVAKASNRHEPPRNPWPNHPVPSPPIVRAAATSPIPLALRQSVQSARPSKMNLAQTVPNRSPACDANRGFKPSPTLCRTQTVSNRFRKKNRKPSNR